MSSSVCEGRVEHLRSRPTVHRFGYSLSMLMVDLAEWDTVFQGRVLWGVDRPAWVALRRRDHLSPDAPSLDAAVRDWVVGNGVDRPTGRILLLTQPAYLGWAMNPVSFYFCLDDADRPRWVVAEVNNTPWGERHCYLLDVRAQSTSAAVIRKSMHVSPFLPMDLGYGWSLDWRDDEFAVRLVCFRGDEPQLSVGLAMRRRPLTSAALRRMLVTHPLMTWRITLGIYAQAARLWGKRVPFHGHPRQLYATVPRERSFV